MAAPKFVPVATVGAFRPDTALPPADGWTTDRPAEIPREAPSAPRMGRPGPDQGYAIKLVNLFHGKLELTEGEHEHDVMEGVLGVALKRAALFGRAPVIHDVQLAFDAFGYTVRDAPRELVNYRRRLFEAAGHHYEIQRAIADAVLDATLRLQPAAVRSVAASPNWATQLALS
jgi:hypothetical protein